MSGMQRAVALGYAQGSTFGGIAGVGVLLAHGRCGQALAFGAIAVLGAVTWRSLRRAA